jgi:uncharacterized membrane protein
VNYLRILYFTLCVLVIAGLVHISIVLLIPAYGTQDAYAQLSRSMPLLAFKPIGQDAADSPVSDIDPYFAYGVCRFDITEEGVAIRAPKIDTFWSATVVDENGSVVYSLNTRTAIDGRLDLVLVNPVMVLRLRELQPVEIENSILVETDMKQGFAVIRVLRPEASWKKQADAFLGQVSCASYVPQPGSGETVTPTPSQ